MITLREALPLRCHRPVALHRDHGSPERKQLVATAEQVNETRLYGASGGAFDHYFGWL
jgi:hypothetical protein